MFLVMLALVVGVRFDLSPSPLAGSKTPVFWINSSSRGVLYADRNCLSSAGLFGFNRMKCDRYTQTSGRSVKLGCKANSQPKAEKATLVSVLLSL